jgi:hypothetical protein
MRSASRQPSSVSSASGCFLVQGGEPVDAVDRAVGEPALQLFEQVVGGDARLEDEGLDPELGQPGGQRPPDAAAVGHDDDPCTVTELDARRPAPFELRPQHRHRDAARDPVGGLQVAPRPVSSRRYLVRSRAGRGSPGPPQRRPRRGPRRGSRPAGEAGRPVADEPDHVVERREVPQLQVLVPLDPVPLTDRDEHLRLLDRVHPEVRLEVQVELQQLRRVARHLRDHVQHRRRDRVVAAPTPRGRPAPGAPAVAAPAMVGRPVADETDHVRSSVGKSRSCRFSSRSIPYRSRTAANTSACLTVSTPRSASRSRSSSSSSGG